MKILGPNPLKYPLGENTIIHLKSVYTDTDNQPLFHWYCITRHSSSLITFPDTLTLTRPIDKILIADEWDITVALSEATNVYLKYV